MKFFPKESCSKGFSREHNKPQGLHKHSRHTAMGDGVHVICKEMDAKVKHKDYHEQRETRTGGGCDVGGSKLSTHAVTVEPSS